MVLAEALFRVPDAATADRLIEDKLAAGRWLDGDINHGPAGVGLGLDARHRRPHHSSGRDAGNHPRQLSRRLGLPAMRAATRQAMRLIGSHFVLGQTIDEALARARGHADFRYSFDMLGEGARTAADAEKYFNAYAAAIAAIGAQCRQRTAGPAGHFGQALGAASALRGDLARSRAGRAAPRVIALAQLAKAHDLQFTVDAEEADRLELSLDVIAAVLGDRSLARLGRIRACGAGLSEARLGGDRLDRTGGRRAGRRLTVRLVKGAYWDTEIKRAQERGLADYPVFTRKAMTDLCYMACVRTLLAARADVSAIRHP